MARNPGSMQHYGLSLWFGTALIVVGVAVNGMAGWRHLHLVRQLNRGVSSDAHTGLHAFSIAILVALVGLAMAIYLVSVRSSTG